MPSTLPSRLWSQGAAILARIPMGKISETTKLILEVYDA